MLEKWRDMAAKQTNDTTQICQNIINEYETTSKDKPKLIKLCELYTKKFGKTPSHSMIESFKLIKIDELEDYDLLLERLNDKEIMVDEYKEEGSLSNQNIKKFDIPIKYTMRPDFHPIIGMTIHPKDSTFWSKELPEGFKLEKVFFDTGAGLLEVPAGICKKLGILENEDFQKEPKIFDKREFENEKKLDKGYDKHADLCVKSESRDIKCERSLYVRCLTNLDKKESLSGSGFGMKYFDDEGKEVPMEYKNEEGRKVPRKYDGLIGSDLYLLLSTIDPSFGTRKSFLLKIDPKKVNRPIIQIREEK